MNVFGFKEEEFNTASREQVFGALIKNKIKCMHVWKSR